MPRHTWTKVERAGNEISDLPAIRQATPGAAHEGSWAATKCRGGDG